MKNLRLLILGGILAGFAVIFQIIPVIFTEVLVILTIFSALPIYIISRANPKYGFISYIVSGLMILLFSYHESMIFVFTNGIVGLALGTCSYYTNRISSISLISSLLLTLSLIILNYIVGIPVFGGKIPGNMAIQFIIIILFSLLYCTIYLYFSKFMFKKLNKYYILDDDDR